MRAAAFHSQQWNPFWIIHSKKVPEHEHVICYQSKIDINDKEYLVRVMVNEAMKPAKVVTVYRTSKIRKYWKTTP